MGKEQCLQSVTDPNWTPAEGELTWTRIDKSTTRALGMIIRLPSDESARVFNGSAESVYCDLDGADRYSIACLTRHGDQDSHVYVPRHYMKPFDLSAALNLKCMKVKAKDTPWDKDKRQSIKAVTKWLEKNESLDSLHHFVQCPECCDEASDVFWAKIKLERGTAHIQRKDSLEKRRAQIKKECKEREELLQQKKLKAKVKGEEQTSNDASTSESESSSGSGAEPSSSSCEDDDEKDENSRSTSNDEESSFEEGSDANDEGDDDDADEDDVEEKQKTSARPKKRRSPNRKKGKSSTSGSRRSFLDSASSEGTEAEEEMDNSSKRKHRRC